MEVSNEIKEDIRKTQVLLKNAIRTHQMLVARLQDDQNNINLKVKIEEAEKDIVAIGQSQKRVVDRLRKELELYQQRLKARNKQINVESDNRYIAQQLRDHQLQYTKLNKNVSLLKPSVLSEILIRTDNNGDSKLNYVSELDYEVKIYEKENSNLADDKARLSKGHSRGDINEHRSNLVNALSRAKDAFLDGNRQPSQEWLPHEERITEESPESPPPEHDLDLSPTPSPLPLPADGEEITQERFLRLLGLVTHQQKEVLAQDNDERRRKRALSGGTSKEFLYENYDANVKRRKLNQFPYLQPHTDPPQTRSAKQRKEQTDQKPQEKSSREGTPSNSSSENTKSYSKPAWAAALPDTLTVEPVYSTPKKDCNACGRNDVPSLLVRCPCCDVHIHTSCGADGRCSNCQADLPDPSTSPPHQTSIYKDKLAERRRLQERNIQLCVELRKLEARAAALKENLDDHQAEKRDLLADQIKTQRNLQKLLDFISQFKDSSIGMQSTSVSEADSSDLSKSNED